MIHNIQTLDQEDVALIEGKAMLETISSCMCRIPANIGKKDTDMRSDTAVGLTDCLFFDIETTGLSAETSFIFLIGCIGYEDGLWKLHQFFIRVVQEEKALLSAFFELTQKYRALIHFNGNTFDLPFIRKRAAVYELEVLTDSLVSIDLYRHYSPLRRILNLPHMNQSFLEKYVGWERTDQMSGKEVVSLFWKYTVSKSKEEEHLLLLHNHDDLLGMLHVPAMEAYDSLLSGKIRPTVTAAESENGNVLLLRFETELPLPAPFERSDTISDSCSARLSAENNIGQLCVPFYRGTLRCFFPDYRNYYYLPLEKQAIHKSVAIYVAKEYRVPASPETCFIEKKGRFLPLPANMTSSEKEAPGLKQPPFSPSLRENYEAKTSYFEYTESVAEKCQMESDEPLLLYTKMLLRSLK
ncbi:MAG: ribonuclease H-like domain-containing protein [Lachnospiraceae bacterium]|nr:ribonuclease H-like domain-containing protein [Lachnospiraceae bacterium]